MTTLLIDGDVFVFRCAYTAQEQVDWGNGLISSWVNTFQAQAHLKRTLSTLKETLNALPPISLNIRLNNGLKYTRRDYVILPQNAVPVIVCTHKL